MQTQTYAEIFEDIAETLTPENWGKKFYFQEDQDSSACALMELCK